MPIFDSKTIPSPTIPEKTVPSIETVASYQGKASSYTHDPVRVTEIEGDPWTVDFYGQLLGADDQPNRLDYGVDPSLQQYTKYHGLVLKVTDAFDFDLDDNVITTLSGGANVYPGIHPNQFDMFVGSLKDGRVGLFVITELPRPLTYLAYTAYVINYQLVRILTDQDLADLERKTVRELYFNPDNPLCPTANFSDLNIQSSLIKQLNRLIDMYYDLFYDRRNQTFVYYADNEKIYDDNVTEFMNAIVPGEIRKRHPRAERFSTPTTDYRNKSKTLFDLLRTGEDYLWEIIDDEYYQPTTGAFYSSHVMNSILFTDIARVNHPSENTTMYAKPDETKGHYIFSEEFYSQKAKTSMELLVLSAVKREAIVLNEAITVIDLLISDATDEELFFKIPVCIWIYYRMIA